MYTDIFQNEEYNQMFRSLHMNITEQIFKSNLWSYFRYIALCNIHISNMSAITE